MPTYDYVCDACGHALELFQSMTESPKRKCPACGTLKLRRLVGTGAGVLFKGSGFYQTDYRSDSYKKGETASKSDASESKPKSDASESKPKDDAKSSSPEKKGGEKKSADKTPPGKNAD